MDYLGQGGLGRSDREGGGEGYARVFAERRDIFVPERLVQAVRESAQAVGQAVGGWVAERADVVRERAAEAYRAMRQARDGSVRDGPVRDGSVRQGGQEPAQGRPQTAQEAAEAYRAMKARQREAGAQGPPAGQSAREAQVREGSERKRSGPEIERD